MFRSYFSPEPEVFRPILCLVLSPHPWVDLGDGLPGSPRTRGDPTKVLQGLGHLSLGRTAPGCPWSFQSQGALEKVLPGSVYPSQCMGWPNLTYVPFNELHPPLNSCDSQSPYVPNPIENDTWITIVPIFPVLSKFP